MKAEQEHMVVFMKQDIFFTEAKINSDINWCECLPDAHLGTIPKNQNKGGRGVLIATH